MAKRPIANSRFLITGASGGIGRALALELARQGGRLILSARRATDLEATAKAARQLGAEAVCVVGDVTDSATQAAMLRAAEASFGGLDVLVNNAGIGAFEPFEQADETQLQQIFDVNFFAAVRLTRLALPLLHRSAFGMVVNVASVLGYQAIPGAHAYCASKFALVGFSQSLRAELAAAGIDVLLVSPSTTNTDFFHHAQARDNWGTRGASPERVARQSVWAIAQGRREIIPSFSGRVLVCAARWLPGLTNWAITRWPR